jgi:hypothetical protein
MGMTYRFLNSEEHDVNYYALAGIVLCCVTWMTRPGRRTHHFTLDILPWFSLAGFVVCDGILSALFAWTAVALAYFSIKFNRLESQVAAAQSGTRDMPPRQVRSRRTSHPAV